MKYRFKLAVVLVFLAFFLVENSARETAVTPAFSFSKTEDTTVKGVWAATIFGLDFPKNPTTDSSSLKYELDNLIEETKNMGFNTIYFQVRPASDAFYKSEIFPWSKYLTGREGVAPDNSFDPLGYIIEKGHENGIKIHAWINPYRVTASENETNTIANKYSDLILNYNGKLYFNPGLPEVNDLIAKGAAEIVKNYDVDGLHIDDYFYPGPDFQDDWSYSAYGGDYPDRDSWRRSNIDSLIVKLHNAVKSANPDVEFGVSPQGIWANAVNHPDGSNTNGRQAYFAAYADTRKWVKENMIDYIIPQIYWNIGYADADFKTLAEWWNSVAEGSDVKLYIGQATYRVSETTNSQSVWYGESGINEIKRQVELLSSLSNVSGYAMYRLKCITPMPALVEAVTEINSKNNEKEIFSDLNLVKWAKADILKLYEKGIVKGLDNGTFGVNNNVTRGQFAVMISRLFGKQAEFTENFADVSKDKYYYNDIGILKQLGLIQGVSDTEFAPESSITRQDAATIVYRILLKEKILEATNKSPDFFKDKDSIASYAKAPVYALSEKGILSGYEDGLFKPLGYTTRAEACVILSRIFDLIN